ncbi:MAG TPA: DUF5996 family protein [Bryobacteraceae bacterium]|nr:DUF5996 family protein [Bryobacteraceae bacterium]
MADLWPELPYEAWAKTYETLHLWTQIVGKTRLTLTPWLNHSWHVTFRVTARGIIAPLIPNGGNDFQIEFDFIDHALLLRTSGGLSQAIALRPMSVAQFYSEYRKALSALDIHVEIDPNPNEVLSPVPFAEDTAHASYDPNYANRHWRVLLRANEVFQYFRTAFLGKASPVQFFWGSFDLAATRYSGRRAPLHPGGVPNLSDAVTREAYSHEESSAGFWPGGGGVDYPAFYSYAYPSPEGFAAAKVKPEAAFFHKDLGEFILPYEAVRTSADPKQTLLDFLQSTYEAAADLGKWDRAALECDLGEPGRPRAVKQ